MAARNLECIKQLEKEIGKKLERWTFDERMHAGQTGFALDKNDQVIGLNLDGIKLGAVPAALGTLSTFRHLQKLSLSNTRLKNISSLQGLINLADLNLKIRRIMPLPWSNATIGNGGFLFMSTVSKSGIIFQLSAKPYGISMPALKN